MFIPADNINIEWYQALLCIVIPFSLGSVFLTTLGLFFSSFVPDKIVVYTIPFLCNYLFSALTYNTGKDGLFFLSLMSSDIVELQGKGLLNILSKSIILLTLTLIPSIGFYLRLKRRIEHENCE